MTKTMVFPLCAFLSLGLTSCSLPTQSVAPSKAASPAYDSNPPAGAIVGMWSNSLNSSDGSRLITSQLFKSDGTGFGHSSFNKELTSPFTWKYDGGGWWTQTPNLSPASMHRFRVSHPSSDTGRRDLYHVFHSEYSGEEFLKYERIK